MEQIISVGSLSSLSNLNFHLTKELKILRESYLNGNGNTPVWDLTRIIPKKVSFAALTAFISISKTIRDFIGNPIEIRVLWHPEFQGFLSDIDFLRIANEFDLYDWKGMLGGYKHNKTSPNTKMFYYNDIPSFEYSDIEKIVDWKDSKREEIKRSIAFRLEPIFDNNYFVTSWNKELEAIFATTISELVVNSLIHGRSIAFIGVQKTRKGITACVCDSGMGFLNSIKKYKPQISVLLGNSNLKALLYSSFHSKNKIGLYRAISDVIKSDGYINLSTFDSEILWRENIWTYFDNKKSLEDILNSNPEDSQYCIKNFVDSETLNNGYFKKYDHFLMGSRITFEIPFSND